MIKNKTILKVKRIMCFFTLLFCINNIFAKSIEDEYKNKVKEYNTSIANHEYLQSYTVAEALLGMDPSDTLSLLRLVYSAKMLNRKNDKIIDNYLHSAAQLSDQDIEIIEFIKAIQTAQ